MTSERVALVTGAARGIGAATVTRLLRDGYAVAALDACQGAQPPPGIDYPLGTQAELDALARRLPGRVSTFQVDVRDPDALRLAVSATVERFGRLDAVVAAAGVMAGGLPQWETPPAALLSMLDVNVLGVWNTAAATIPAMLEQPQGGRFVAVASAAAERGLFRLSAYAASKHAVVGIVRGLAADLVGTPVTAVAVSPGSTDTRMLEATARTYATTPHDLAQHQGIRRLLAPSEIAATIALCCSPDGAALNGSVVRAEGGFVS